MLVAVTYGEEHGPLAIAHRGGLALGPENTLATFARTTALGVRYLETDVRTTRDGGIVCFHDATLRRTTGERGAVADLALRANPGWAARVCVAGAWSRRLLRLQAVVPQVTTALGWRDLTALVASSRSRTRTPSGLARGSFAHVPHRLGRFPVHAERVVRRAHALGIRVAVWTVNDTTTMGVLLDAGVDAIITDHPDLLREVLLTRGQWHPLHTYTP